MNIMQMKTRLMAKAPYVIVLWLLVALAAGYGWVMNIVKIVDMGFEPLSGLVIFRCIGVFVPPLGVILGYIG
jgi:hypothetical protein